MSRSIMQDKSKHRCYICDIFCGDGSVKPYLEEHHVFGGPRRKKSEHYGLKVYLCRKHHTGDITGSREIAIRHASMMLKSFVALRFILTPHF